MRMRRLSSLLLVAAVLNSACEPAVDLTTALRVETISTGWVEAGVVAGQNKVVPAVSLRLKNASDRKLRVLQLNAVFRRVGDPSDWGSGFVTAAGSDGLPPAATVGPLFVHAELGYTGSDPHRELLRHPQFVDATVDVFAKYGSTQWTRIGAYPITRQLIAAP